MHVLVTGANGYLGSVLIPMLKASKTVTRVTALVRQRQRFTEGKYAYLNGVSIMDTQDLLSGKCSFDGVNVVCHLAASRDSNMPGDIADFMGFTHTLLTQLARARVNALINTSSHAVYGMTKPVWTEESPAAPATIYGMAKLATEFIIKSASLASPPINTISLRISKLVGPSPSMRIAPSEYPHIFSKAALLGKALKMKNNGDQKLDFIDVRDAAEVIVRLVEIGPKTWPEIMNVGSGQQVSMEATACLVSNIARTQYGKPLQIDFTPTANKYRNFGMSISRLEKLLQWKARYTLDETIGDVLNILKQR
ncbi:MAG: NAD(P)-dependent oxidoreductase [Porticoccaceae bacterium]